MLHSFSFGELALVFGIIVILFGGSRIASIGKSLGEGISNFKKGLNSSNEEKPQPTTQIAPRQQVDSTPHRNEQIASHQQVDSTFHRNEHVVDVETKA